MLEAITNQHAHEYASRPSGHYKIYLAGPNGTQITTLNQLTDDRVVLKTPENKYSHINQPDGSGNLADPGNAYVPLKLVDPTGAYLPEGVYNFVWTWWWPVS